MNNPNNKYVRIRWIDFDRAIELINFEPITIQKYNDLYTFTDIEENIYNHQIISNIKNFDKLEFENGIKIYTVPNDTRKIIEISNITPKDAMKLLNKHYDDIIITSAEDKTSILLDIPTFTRVAVPEVIYTILLIILKKCKL